MSAAFLPENTGDRRKWQNKFKVLKEKHCQPLYLAKIPFRNEDKDIFR